MAAVNNPRAVAAQLLVPVLAGKGSLAALDTLGVAERDKSLVKALCYGVCRTLPRLEALAALLLSRGFKSRDTDIHALLLVGLYQLLYMRVPSHAAVSETAGAARQLGKAWATRVLNACLRRCQREQQALEAQVDKAPESQLLHPQWLHQALHRAWPEQFDELIAANNTPAPMTLRVNLARISREHYQQQLTAAGIESHCCTDSSHGLTLANAHDATALPGFADGQVSVQDEAAQLAAPLLLKPLLDGAPSQPLRVLDACSAPGGKTLHLIELAEAAGVALDITALDSDPQRLERVRDAIKRGAPGNSTQHRVIAADAAQQEWWDGTPFDAILLDAPCSGTGVIRRHPDIKRLRTARDIEQLAQLQQRILDNLWPMLRDSGRMLYATCSVMPQENEAQAAAFAERTGDARQVALEVEWGIATAHGRQRLPQQEGGDGFFYALFEKQSA
ncbi:16S rRNA (cytosine(967)-C(5))-methyltransferase RsmB [Carnimonas bestiolae]|uniref:16S rRNA (cytosine(967)-C(5))-methyltransferase RsmB n=1 Tax=Carnimonas bestiolae TaxID=3402172 RepID=UPI003EDC5122